MEPTHYEFDIITHDNRRYKLYHPNKSVSISKLKAHLDLNNARTIMLNNFNRYIKVSDNLYEDIGGYFE